MSTSDSYVYPPRPSSALSSNSSLDSLPSSLTSDELDDAAQREWEASLQQLELILTMVLVPYLGKYFGRKCAYWGWAKYMEWMYPHVEVRMTNSTAFKAAGAVEAAATL